ncbi:MAG: hypothetical protein VYA22_01515 [Pseudomonadota bacterium]|nr:hypothetical protein [Pseudomonadota bacterium]
MIIIKNIFPFKNPTSKPKIAFEDENPNILTSCVEKNPKNIITIKVSININI